MYLNNMRSTEKTDLAAAWTEAYFTLRTVSFTKKNLYNELEFP